MRASVTLLQYDHGLIRQMTDVLGDMSKHDTMGKHQKQVLRIADFLDQYVQKHHHAKEERCLFPVAEKLSSELAEMASGLKQDHRRFGSQIKRFKELAKRREAYTDGTLAHVSKGLVEQMSKHIRFEEDQFFPKIEDGMSVEMDADVVAAYEEFLKTRFDPDFFRMNEDLATKMQDEVLGPGYYLGIH